MREYGEDRVYSGWQDLYRDRWKWDAVYWGTHCVDCYPGNCPMRVYVRNGLVWREEQSGTVGSVESGVPDWNPMGCMQGVSWSQSLYGPDRVLYPLKRAGERGEGKWNRISWDQALSEIADGLIDAIQESGPRSIMHEGSPEVVTAVPTSRFIEAIGGLGTDVNGSINDFTIGMYETFGKFSPESSSDDWFHSELVLLWHTNVVYTRIPFYHFIAEARYNGAEVVNISPDINPTHLHADIQIPVKGTSDAAFALSLVQVMFAENIADWKFLKEQTDFSLLVRKDTRRYLRQPDLDGAGREDQLYQWEPGSGLRPASRGDLRLSGFDVALEGEFEVVLADGSSVTVTPVFELLRAKLDSEFTPEKQQPVTGVHPDVVRDLARKMTSRRTNVITGANACKMYHGDLMERAICLALAASGNWGKKGTGIRGWSAGLHDGMGLAMAKPGPGAANTEIVLAARDAAIAMVKQLDPTMTTEMAVREMGRGPRGALREFASMLDRGAGKVTGASVPPAFGWYRHAGYDKRWNVREWGDESLPRTFDEYFNEALERGWWDGVDGPAADEPPRVLIECGGNTLRRTRGGKNALLPTLWEKLKLIVMIDFRMNETALYADYFLPAAQHYEKIAFALPGAHVLNLTFSDQAAKPAGEAKSEWDLFSALLAKMAERAAARGIAEIRDARGNTKRYDALVDEYTMNGHFANAERLADEQVRDSALAGTLPPRTTLETFREKGHVRFIDWGLTPLALSQASPLKADETHSPFRDHVERGVPYPTYCRRAQFYIDHEWFLEAGEEMPTHKPNPRMGGDYPLGLSSGHSRWSVHSMNHTNEVVLGTHRGEPTALVNPDDAKARRVADGDLIRIFNDLGSFPVRARLAPSVRPGQIVSYNGWDGSQYRGWGGANEIEPGMVKWIGFAGGYGHLAYLSTNWQPVPADRWVRCDFESV
ncbi:molybdopterin-dependent oxidoreductase [Candidatus Amarobacter glycogenicus]|uniref:molybdopterin-dependent oxidoreductase n=1 Tax=Candidatus Amarobacter glycogenicus TaxID=3140699 RepID=UPI002A0FA01D|nr:molybdopterin-dependent oxidoreductase [Dehalococcoidia bacterium]